MGYDKDLFTENVSSDFVCSICLDVFEDPVSLEGCEHVFCRACIAPVVRSYDRRSCPNCNRSITGSLRPPHRLVLNIWNQLVMKCKYADAGCRAQVKIENLAHHASRCDFNPLNNVSCDDCGIKGAAMNGHSCVTVLKKSLTDAREELKTFQELAKVKCDEIEKLDSENKELEQQLQIKDTVIRDQLEQMKQHLEIKDMRIAELLQKQQVSIERDMRSMQMRETSPVVTGVASSAPVAFTGVQQRHVPYNPGPVQPDIRKLMVGKPYHWGSSWSILKGNVGGDFLGDFLYMWSNFVCIQLGDASYGYIRYMTDRIIYNLTPDGESSVAPTHNRDMFMDKYYATRAQVTHGEHWSIGILSAPSHIQSSSGVWVLSCEKSGEIIIKNTWEPLLSITLRQDFNGFIFTTKGGNPMTFRGAVEIGLESLRDGPETKKPEPRVRTTVHSSSRRPPMGLRRYM